MKRLYLYQVTNLVNGKLYIGTSKDYNRRWKDHQIGNGSKLVAAAIKKYGRDQFDFELLACGPDWYIMEAEPLLIQAFQTRSHQWGYNIGEGGEGGNNRGTKCSKEARKRMSKSQKARYRPIVLDGHEYFSVPKAAKQLGISVWCLHKRIQRQRAKGVTILLTSQLRQRGTSIIFDDIRYSSLAKAAMELGIKERTLRGRVWKQRQRGISENCLESCPKHLPCGGASPNYQNSTQVGR